MDNLILNAAIYCCTTIYFLSKYRTVNIYTMLWIGFSVFQLCGPICVKMNLHLSYDVDLGQKIPLTPFLCQYIFVHLLTYPFKKFDPSKIDLQRVDSTLFKILVYASLVIFFVVDIIRLNELIITFKTGFGAAYDLSHEGSDLFQYPPLIGKIRAFGTMYCSIFQPFIALFFFQRLALQKGNFLWNYSALLIGFLPPILTGAAFGSRGALFFSFLKIVFYYFVFKNMIPVFAKKVMAIAGGVFVAGLIVVSFLITSERADEGSVVENSATENIIRYFGEPPANNAFFYDKVVFHPMGERFYPEFGENLEYKYSNERERYRFWSKYTQTNIALFKNFWLDCYVEFGMAGSWLYGLFFLGMWNLFVFRKKYAVYMYPLICYYYTNIVVDGIFAHGFTGSHTHMMFVYLILVCFLVKKTL